MCFGAFGFAALGFGALGFETFRFDAFGFGTFGCEKLCFRALDFETFRFETFGLVGFHDRKQPRGFARIGGHARFWRHRRWRHRRRRVRRPCGCRGRFHALAQQTRKLVFGFEVEFDDVELRRHRFVAGFGRRRHGRLAVEIAVSAQIQFGQFDIAPPGLVGFELDPDRFLDHTGRPGFGQTVAQGLETRGERIAARHAAARHR